VRHTTGRDNQQFGKDISNMKESDKGKLSLTQGFRRCLGADPEAAQSSKNKDEGVLIT
jgi:hypothetical protein